MITTQIDDLVGRPTGVKTQAFLYVLCGLAEAAVYVALLPLLRSLIAGDYVAAGYLVALAAALALLHSVIGFFADNRGYCIGIEQICHALQDALGDHIVRLPLGWFTKERSGQVAALLTKELQMAMDVPSTFLRQMVIAVTTPAAVVVLFLFVDWRIGLVFVIAAPLLLWASRAMAKAAGEGHRQEELSNAEVAARVLEFAHAQPVLRATKRSVEGWDALQQAIERDRAATVATLRTASAPVARYTMLIQVVFAVVFATATALLAWGQIDVASYVFVAVLSLRLVDPLTLIGSQGMALRVAKNALDASEGILKTPPLPETRNPRVPCGSSVAFDRVGFAYEESRPVLQGVSLTCPERSLTALVGPSGSGKTTLTRLVARFWDVSEGSVSIGGVDVRDMRPDELMQQISLVFQDVYLFHDTVAENIRMGRPAATDAEVEAVAKAAGCDAFIRSLEHGYDTVVGGGGAHLSGGERQRIAIARAMLKDAPIVVLDEATAYIDPENEAVVQQAVGKLVAGKTVLVIAHRLSTITGADQIVVVNGGRSQDVGTHGELLKNCPLYQEMWRAHMGAKEGEQA